MRAGVLALGTALHAACVAVVPKAGFERRSGVVDVDGAAASTARAGIGTADGRAGLAPGRRHAVGISADLGADAALGGGLGSDDLAGDAVERGEERPGFWSRTFAKVASDYEHFYDAGTLLALGVGVGAAGLAANSDFDTEVQSRIQARWRRPGVDHVRDNVTWLGKFEVLVPATALAAWLGPELGSDAVGVWAERTLRAYVVSGPMTVALQRVTGAGRPDEPSNTHGSDWRFFDSSHGVSGHAVVGSIPFLTIAKLQDDPWIDALCYAASTIVGLARLQANRHYPSQVALGWWIGYLATEAVDDSAAARGERTSWAPVLAPDYVGFVVSHRL